MQESASSAASENPSLPPEPWLADIFGPFEVESSSAKAARILGWTPLVPLPAGLQASIQWLAAMGITETAQMETLESQQV